MSISFIIFHKTKLKINLTKLLKKVKILIIANFFSMYATIFRVHFDL